MSVSDGDLVRVLTEVQRRGGIGPVAVPDAVAHARRYVRALGDVEAAAPRVVDLGSGGGLPALVIAVDRPSWHLLLVERRTKRADLLRFAVRALGLVDRVDVTDEDVAGLERSSLAGTVDVVTARSFAPLPVTLASAARLLTVGGWVAVSEPPPDARMPRPDLVELGLVDVGTVEQILRFRRTSER
jgi:tRNA A58 N-methylase Trm61